ncbi:MAG: ABC transporter substrate-binding protein, partial [Acidimicrobiia bacterium]
REVEYRYFLVWSGYGQILLVKLALVAGMLALGAWVGLNLRRPRSAARARRDAAPATAGVGRSLRTEAVLGVAVLVFAATLAGVAQGRGQPLPAQRESVLAGPAFASAVVGGGVARLVLAPAAPGANRLSVLMGGEPGAAPTADETPRGAAQGVEDVEVSLTCDCRSGVVKARLVQGSDTWHADVELPAEGIWRASIAVDGQKALAPVALRVAEEGAPGAPPVFIAAPADLSGKGAPRCRSFQLGMLVALGFLNVEGGVNGRKVVLHSTDDGGDPRRARELARELSGAALAVPCGSGGRGAVEALAGDVPVVVADPVIPPVAGERIFRTAGDPFAEGWAVGRTVATSAFTGRLEAPRRMAVVVEEGDVTTDRAVAGVRAALSLDPARAEVAEGRKSENTADVAVEVLSRPAGSSLLPLVRQAMDGARYVAAFFRSEPDDTAGALDSLSAQEITLAAAALVSGPAFDEQFYLASKIGRRGDVTVLGEVAPDSEESLLYTSLVRTLFPGESPTINGLRGWMAGKAVVEGLAEGVSAGAVARLLQVGKLTGLYAKDGLVSGWSPAAPGAGSWRFFLYKGSFIPSGLQPGEKPEPGRFFPQGGAWSRVATGNVGLCGPQESFAGAAPDCASRPKSQSTTTGSR